MKISVAPGLAAAVALCAYPAVAASFRLQQIAILGSTQVAASGINDAGTIIGTVDVSQGQAAGFVLQGSTLSLLSQGFPSAINAVGEVTGIGSGGGFAWKNGAYIPGVSFQTGVYGNAHLTPVLNRRGELAYSTSPAQGSFIAYAGQPQGHLHPVQGLSTSAIVQSITRNGTIAGFERATIQGQPVQVVFVGKDGLFDELLSPSGSGLPVSGGFANDLGDVAFTDGQHGYVYHDGHTNSFTLPGTPFNVAIQAINNHGRVVGSYADGSQSPAVQRGFLYNGSTVSTIGAYVASDIVQLALNQRGVMTLSLSTMSGPVASYRVSCHGTGC